MLICVPVVVGNNATHHTTEYCYGCINNFNKTMKIPLSKLAHARSGDKGDAANCGVIAYKEEWYPIIRDALSTERVKKHFEGVCLGEVERYELPNLWAVNFVLHNTLGGGGTVSLKLDAQGKTIASAMLLMEIDVSDTLNLS
jgi:hypothetical protein